MISGKEFYEVMVAMVPLYVAMILAYGSVRWWRVFSPEQCAGINRYVALFVVPFLSFDFISKNDPYNMNFRFIMADVIQKLIVLAALAVWALVGGRRAGLDWTITIFSISTLPNTLVIGIPLFLSMYGDGSAPLLSQIIVMQCIVWFTLLLILLECRAAKIMIADQFPGASSGAIASITVDPEVVSLGNLDVDDPIETESCVDDDGKLHVVVRRSSAFRSDLNHSRNSFDFTSSFSNDDIYRQQSLRYPSGEGARRSSSYSEAKLNTRLPRFRHQMPYSSPQPTPNPSVSTTSLTGAASRQPHLQKAANGGNKDLHMFTRSFSASPAIHAFRKSPAAEHQVTAAVTTAELPEELSINNKTFEEDETAPPHQGGDGKTKEEATADKRCPGEVTAMPPTVVMMKLILTMAGRKLIRNPITYSTLIGLIWSLVKFRWDLELPRIIDKSLELIQNTGLGMAMFGLGMFMALQSRLIACGYKLAIYGMVLKFLLGPAVMAIPSAAFGLRGDLLRIAIVQAAMPCSVVSFVFAKEYNLHADILSTAVITGMIVTVPVALVYYILLGL
ncbi:probable auxin efflux carrier component 1c [Zingiber officinale]|uniref:probable auxin efflux carrier component 1c n=1 Tax=Zingiber officinale TaxID=94328 RepID=UPI001C4BB8DA|nr:probable auxin efflux carrier component 1c [Zingiber officinale]